MKVEDIFKKLKPVAGKSLDLLWQEYLISDSKTQKVIETGLQLILARVFGETFEETEILLEPPPEDIAYGEYLLGSVYYDHEKYYSFGLRENEWIQHIGIFGRSGSGKTNIVFNIILELIKHRKKFLLFDWKRNYRDLYKEISDEMLIFTVGRNISPFYFNPLIPPESTSPAVWLKKIIEIMCHAYFLGEGVSFLLQKAFDAVYRDFGVYAGKVERFPNLLDVKEWLENYKAKGRESAWMDSALRAVGVLCFGETGRIFNSNHNLPIEKLLEKNVVLELDALTNTDKTFLIESLLLWIHHFRMGEGKREFFKHADIIEEAHHILLRKKQEVMGEETVTDVILREIRELGEAVILIDQHPSLISKPALGNTYCTIAMNLKHRSDINMIADSLLLDTKEKKYLGKLETGWGMVKLQGRWHKPFLVRFPLVDIEKGACTDKKVIKIMERFREVIRPYKEVIRSRAENIEDFRDSRSGEKIEKEEGKISREEKELLLDIKNFPVSSITDRYKRIGVNAYQGNRIKNFLIRRGLARTKDMPTRNGRIKLLLLTEKGNIHVNGHRKSIVSNRKGSYEHIYWIDRLYTFFRSAGYTAVKEKPIGKGRTVDLVLMKNGKRYAVELETGKSEPVFNIEKCLKAGFDRILCVCLNERVKKKVENDMVRFNLPVYRIEVLTPEEVLKRYS